MINFLVDLFIPLNNLLFGNLGLTIIVVSILSKVVVWPLTKANLQHTRRMQDLKPQLDALKAKYGNDRKRLSEEQMKLFKETGVNPAAGCLPLIVQLVVLIVLLNIITELLKRGLDTSFLRWDLGKPDVFRVEGVPFNLPGIIVVLTAIATLVQAKMMLPQPVKVNKDDKPKEKEQKEDMADAMMQVQSQMVFLSPILIAYAGTTFPAGVALYWLVTTVVAIIQQYQAAGLGGLRPWLHKLRLVK